MVGPKPTDTGPKGFLNLCSSCLLDFPCFFFITPFAPFRFQGLGGHELPISLQSAARYRRATGRWDCGSGDFASLGGAEVLEDGHLEKPWEGECLKNSLEGMCWYMILHDIIYIYICVCIYINTYYLWSIHYIYIYIYVWVCAWYMLVWGKPCMKPHVFSVYQFLLLWFDSNRSDELW